MNIEWSGMLEEMEWLSREQTRELWERFLRLDGIDLFRLMLREMQDSEEIVINLKTEPRAIPDYVVIMVVMRAAIKTLAITGAVESWIAAHQDGREN